MDNGGLEAEPPTGGGSVERSPPPSECWTILLHDSQFRLQFRMRAFWICGKICRPVRRGCIPLLSYTPASAPKFTVETKSYETD